MIGLWVAIGGGLGAVARFAMGGWVTTWAGAGFPWGTFSINLLGSLVLGFVNAALPAPAASPSTRAFLAIGLCGGFTTFSTFDFETLVLFQQSRYVAASLYSLGSAATCIAGVFLGMAGGAWIRRGGGELAA